MAVLIVDEKKFIDENIFKYESRLNTQISRFLDKTPTFVTYYHIDPNDTTTDAGFKDVEELVGDRSPIRFQKIENFPIYGLEAIMLSLEENDEGLNSGYNGEAVILPNTLAPLQNDYFIIPHLREKFIFRVTGIAYDNIRPDNYYQIDFKLEYIDDRKEDELNNQVKEKFTCVLQNIGTENNCIIQEDYYNQLMAIDEMYNDMVSTYMAIFYNATHNCLLGEYQAIKLFDPLQSQFINKHGLLNKVNNIKTFVLSEGFEDNKRKLLYEKSIYRFFERRDCTKSREFNYHISPAMQKVDSSFYRWHDESIYVVDVSDLGDHNLLPLTIANIFRLNGDTESKYVELMRRFIRNEPITIYDIPTDLNDALLSLDANEEFFFFTPILMYIINVIVKDFLKTR